MSFCLGVQAFDIEAIILAEYDKNDRARRSLPGDLFQAWTFRFCLRSHVSMMPTATGTTFGSHRGGRFGFHEPYSMVFR